MIRSLLLASFAVVSIPSTSYAAPNIDILLVFSEDSNLSTFQKTVVASRYQTALSAVYDQLDGNETIELWPLLSPEMPYNAADKSPAAIVQWITNENSILTSKLRVGRESLGNPAADLVLIVVPGTTSSIVCGRATPIPKGVNKSKSESSAFAFVVLEEEDPGCLEEQAAPHEIGHLLYAEHETDINGDDLLPSYSNHATQSSTSTLVSLMWHSIVNTVDYVSTNFLSGSRSSMTTAWADNGDFISKKSFAVVSQYRAPPPFCRMT